MTFAKTINMALSRLGLNLIRTSPLDHTQKLVLKLQETGLDIRTVYDIGAYKGEYTKSLRKVIPGAVFFLFEANEIHAAELNKTNSRFFLEVLSSESSSREWWSVTGTGDSLFREAQDVYSDIRPQIRITKTLDSIIQEEHLPLPDLIKIDVQGAEIEVLRGGCLALENASVITLEMPILEYNLGAPKIGEYLEFMKDSGFIPVEILEVHKASEALTQIDVAFLKRDFLKSHYDISGRNFLE